VTIVNRFVFAGSLFPDAKRPAVSTQKRTKRPEKTIKLLPVLISSSISLVKIVPGYLPGTRNFSFNPPFVSNWLTNIILYVLFGHPILLYQKMAQQSRKKQNRLKALWEHDYQGWNARDLKLKRYVYFRVGGIHFNVRLDEERSCILVVMEANESGRKQLLAVGDGALGFRAALREVYPGWRVRSGRSQSIV
jgi:uncharacterized membrane protein SirB2